MNTQTTANGLAIPASQAAYRAARANGRGQLAAYYSCYFAARKFVGHRNARMMAHFARKRKLR